MGHYASRFQQGQAALEIGGYSRSYEAEWIVEHSRVTGLSILGVERLWQRFQQLGCDNVGILRMTDLPQKIRRDAFGKKVLEALLNRDGLIHFYTFCNLALWLEAADTETRSKAVFQLLSKDKNLNKDQMYAFMKITFPTETDASVYKLSDILMRSMDDRHQGYVTEDQFVQFLRRIPEGKRKKILSFSIIPDYIDLNAPQGDTNVAQESYRPSSSEHSRQIPTDFILMEVAQKACRRDWYMLGNLLDFTSTKLADFDSKHQEPRDKAFAMLKSWRDREGKKAHLIKLERALRQSGMNDIAMLLQP